MISPKAIIVSAPSGAGKTTIVRYLLEKIPTLRFSISTTSRKKRHNEVDGKDYYFLTESEFKKKIRNDEFVEWEEVYVGVFYGTLKNEINRIWEAGNHIIFDVDVKGGVALKKYFGKKGLSIFIGVKSVSDLQYRLEQRETDTKESIEKRLSKAKYEMGFMDKFDKVVINDVLSESCLQVENLVLEFLNN